MKDTIYKDGVYVRRFLRGQLRSPWVIVMTVPILLITVLIVQSKYSSVFTVGELMNGLGYYGLFMGVVFAVYGGYCSFSIDEFDYSLYSRTRVLLLRCLSGMLFCMLSALAVMAVMTVLSVMAGISLRLFVSYLVYIFLKFFTQIAVLFILGFLLGIGIKNRFLYLATILLSFVFSPIFDAAFQSSNETLFIRNFFNLAHTNPNYIRFSAAGLLDREFLTKCLFWIAAAAFALFAALLVTKKGRHRPLPTLALPAGTIALALLLCLCVSAYPIMLPIGSGDNQIVDRRRVNYYPNEGAALPYAVTGVKMDLTLGETLKNTCTLNIHMTQPADRIRLKLDRSFDAKIRSDDPDSKKESYYSPFRDGDYLYADVPELKDGAQDFELVIQYSGNLNYQAIFHSKVFYTTREACHLPPFFSWYPQLTENNNEIDFDVTVHANNRFVSNLSGGRLVKEKTYRNTATLRQLYILSGYFTEVQAGGVNCIVYEGYRRQTKALEETVQEHLAILNEIEKEPDNTTEKIYERFQESYDDFTQPYDSSKIKTIVFCPFAYNSTYFVHQYDETLFVEELI